MFCSAPEKKVSLDYFIKLLINFFLPVVRKESQVIPLQMKSIFIFV